MMRATTKRTATTLVTFLSAALLATAACGGKEEKPTTPATTEAPPAEQPPGAETPPAEAPAETPPAGPTAAEQVGAGESVWKDSCAGCHGDGGEGKGKKNPAVVGASALSKFKTGAELYTFVKEKMPKDDPGTLSDDQAMAVTAWMASKNGKLGDAALTDDSAAALSLH